MSDKYIRFRTEETAGPAVNDPRGHGHDVLIPRSAIEAVVREVLAEENKCDHPYRQRYVFGPGAICDVCFQCKRPWPEVEAEKAANRPRDIPEAIPVFYEEPIWVDGEERIQGHVEYSHIKAVVLQILRAVSAAGLAITKEGAGSYAMFVLGEAASQIAASPNRPRDIPEPHRTVDAHLAEQMEDPEFRAKYLDAGLDGVRAALAADADLGPRMHGWCRHVPVGEDGESKLRKAAALVVLARRDMVRAASVPGESHRMVEYRLHSLICDLE